MIKFRYNFLTFKEEEGNLVRLKSIVHPILHKINTKINETLIIVFSEQTVTPLIYFLKVSNSHTFEEF